MEIVIQPRYIDIDGNINISQMADDFRDLVRNKLQNRDVIPHGRRVRRFAANNPIWNEFKNALFGWTFDCAQLRVSENSEEVDNQIQHDARILLHLFRANIWPPAYNAIADNDNVVDANVVNANAANAPNANANANANAPEQ